MCCFMRKDDVLGEIFTPECCLPKALQIPLFLARTRFEALDSLLLCEACRSALIRVSTNNVFQL